MQLDDANAGVDNTVTTERKSRLKMGRMPQVHWKHLKVIYKLYVSYSVILAILLIIGLVSLYGINRIQKAADSLYNTEVNSVSSMLRLSQDFQQLNSTVSSSLLMNPAAAKDQVGDIRSLKERVAQEVEATKSNSQSHRIDESQTEVFSTIWKVYSDDLEQVLQWVSKSDQSVEGTNGLGIAVSIYNQKMKSRIDTLSKLLNEWVAGNQQLSQESYLSVAELKSSIVIWQAVLIMAAIICSIGVGWIVARSIVKPLAHVVEHANGVAQGKLNRTIELDQKDEVGLLAAAFNSMIGHISHMVQQVKQAGDHIQMTSAVLADVSRQSTEAFGAMDREIRDIASGAAVQEQASAETAKAMQEMAAGVQHIAEASSEVVDASHSATLKATEGREAMHKTAQQMDTIRRTVKSSSLVIHGLEERSQQIGSMIAVVSDIAAQTHLLALNAAIEAARAGEAGRGFAVVADEVRKLSISSEQSTRQMTVWVKDIVTGIQEAVHGMNLGTREVEAGTEVLHEAEEAFQNIRSSVQQVFERIERVTATVEEISAGTEEVAASAEGNALISKDASEKMVKVADTVQTQRGSMKELLSSAQSLESLAEQLQKAIIRFEV